jgi:D-2-hydroxyacid dehydrogenase (NADP+)
MKSLNVLVMAPAFDGSAPHTDEETLKRIALAGPGINVVDASELAVAEHRGDANAKGKLDAMLAKAEVIYGIILPQNLVARAPKLKWFQTMSAGVDRFSKMDIWESPVTITNVSGIHTTPIGEFAIEFMLMFAKGAPQCFRMQQKHEWKRFMPAVLRDKTVGIVGLGNIGREIARLSKAFGMKTIATRRSAIKQQRARYVDVLLPAAQLHQLLSESDYVIVATPLTPETRGLIGEKELRAMKPGAYIINIARGGIIDEEALIRALDEKRIAGAGLDVVTSEPLPPDSPLWDYENVILTPHVSGGMEDYIGQATGIFCENLKRYLNGEKLLNVIDKKKGY